MSPMPWMMLLLLILISLYFMTSIIYFNTTMNKPVKLVELKNDFMMMW
uniref:ATP synthase F0 subunit 8 n=1 Tax=Calophya schini TaxID=121824 RepID=A0A343LDR7_9HEMI|nr:ATP synthase F0 subunit 8 [Calophya schini]